MVRAIIFDCFGVLTYDGWLPFKRKHFGNDNGKEQEATALGTLVNKGLLSYDEFIAQIAALAAVPPSEARKAIHDNVPNDELFAYIRTKLKPRYKIGMLSNAGRDMLSDIFSAAQLKLFDAVALSYEIGGLKPERRSYESIAERLGIEPPEGIFIDDQERHCIGARDVGMQTVLYRNFEQMKADLEKIL